MPAFTKNSNQNGHPSSLSKKAGSTSFFGIQAKLSIGKPNDKYEKEADSVADKVVAKSNKPDGFFGSETFFPSAPPKPNIQKSTSEEVQKQEDSEEIQEKPLAESITPVVQLATDDDEIQQQANEEEQIQEKCEACEGEEQQVQTMPFEEVQQKSNAPKSSPSNLESTLSSTKGQGSAMDDSTKSQMESGFGTDFSNVRIHNNSTAIQMNQELGSQAFANGNDIYFNEGKFAPSSKEGQHLLAHELTHTVQQGASIKPKLVQSKSENSASKIDEEVNKELPNNKSEDTSQKGNSKTEDPNQNTEEKPADVAKGTAPINDNLQATDLNKVANNLSKNDTKSSNGVLNQAQIAPIDKPPNQSHLKKTEENAEKNMQASKGKADQKPQTQKGASNKKGKPNKNKGLKSNSGTRQVRPNNDSSSVSTININNNLPTISNTRSVGGRLLLTKINESYLQLQQQFLNRYQQKKEGLSAFVSLQQQELAETGSSIEQRIANTITNARASIVNNTIASQGQVSSHRITQDGVLIGSQNNATTNVASIFTTGQTDVTNESTTLANRSIQTANDSANQLQTNVTQSVNEANSLGEQKANVSDSDAGVRSAKQRTAREIAADSSEKIAGGRADAEQKIRETGPMAATEFQNQGREAASQLILGKSQVDSELVNIFSNAKVGIGSMADSSNQSLQQTQTQILDQLVDLEMQLLAQLRTEIDKKIADLHKAGQETMRLFDEQAEQALTRSRMQLETNNREIATANISEQKVDEAHTLTVSEMTGGFDAMQSSFDSSEQEATNQLAQQNTELKGKLGNTQSVILSQIDTFTSSARSQIDESKENTITQLSDATGQAISGSNQIVSQVDTNIGQQVQTINDNFTSGFIDFEGNLGTQVNEATEEARAPLGDLNSRIDQGQARAATRAERSWLSNQFHDAVEMLSSPGFWAGLVVGLLLTIVFLLLIAGTALTGGALLAVLVVGFAVIGAIAAAVGSVVNQAMDGSFSGGWDWSRVDWGQVGMAALFGAVAGAVFAVVAFVAVEVFGVAIASFTFIAIMSVTSGVITIITNLINGQPWDKDLLINMTIAAFFAWLARFFPGGRGRPTEEVPPDAPDPIPGRGRGRGTEPEVPQPTRPSIPERLAEYYRRLGNLRRARNAEEGMEQVRETLTQVEDDLSGIPKSEPPPPPGKSDGRMYPPMDDFIQRNPDGSMSARTRGHNIEIGADGEITITNRRNSNIDFNKPGAGNETP